MQFPLCRVESDASLISVKTPNMRRMMAMSREHCNRLQNLLQFPRINSGRLESAMSTFHVSSVARMLRQYLVGTAVSVCNIAIHALVMVAVIRVARIRGRDIATSRQWLRLIAVMIATVSVLMVAHFAEVLVWSLTYAIVGAAPPGTAVTYFAFVNYTTLGYGDVIPVERWHLLGPMTAMNGVLLFGWSTAVTFRCCGGRWVSCCRSKQQQLRERPAAKLNIGIEVGRPGGVLCRPVKSVGAKWT